MISRRGMLAKLGLGVVATPVIASGVVRELIAGSPPATELVEDINKRVEEDHYSVSEELEIGQSFTYFNHFNSGDVCVINGDQIKLNHSVAVLDHLSVTRYRAWDITRALIAVGCCVEGLVIRDGDKLRLANNSEVSLIEDSHTGITREGWEAAICNMVLKEVRSKNVTS